MGNQATIEELKVELAERDKKVTQLERAVELKDRQLAVCEKTIDDMIRKYVVRKKAEHPDVDTPLIDGFMDLFEELIDNSKAFEEDEEAEEQLAKPAKKSTKRKKKRSGRQPIPAHLERKIEIIDPEDEQIDPITGEELPIIRHEDTVKYDIIPSRIIAKVYRRVIRALPGGKGVNTPDLPPCSFPKCKADHGFIAEVEVRRFDEHIPFDRQAQSFRRESINLHRNTLDGWHLKAGNEVLVPVFEAHKAAILSRDYIGFDDSPVGLQVKGKGQLHKARIWICRANTGPPLVFYQFSLTKEKEEVANLLGDFEGYAHADAYAGHDEFMAKDGVTEVGCWAHTTRKFIEARPLYPKEVSPILNLIRRLYDVEEETVGSSEDERLALRQKKSVQILGELYARIEAAKVLSLPKDALATAATYALNQKEALHRYLEDGRLLIDNNPVERGIRPWGIGRKNWLFFGSEAGANAAAVVMSLVQSCRNLKINPWLYLKDLFDRLPNHPADKMDELIPSNWKPLQKNTELGVPVYLDIEQQPYRPI